MNRKSAYFHLQTFYAYFSFSCWTGSTRGNPPTFLGSISVGPFPDWSINIQQAEDVATVASMDIVLHNAFGLFVTFKVEIMQITQALDAPITKSKHSSIHLSGKGPIRCSSHTSACISLKKKNRMHGIITEMNS